MGSREEQQAYRLQTTTNFTANTEGDRIREEGRAEHRTTKTYNQSPANHPYNRRWHRAMKMTRVVAREWFRLTRGFACPAASLPRSGPSPSQGLACMLALLGAMNNPAGKRNSRQIVASPPQSFDLFFFGLAESGILPKKVCVGVATHHTLKRGFRFAARYSPNVSSAAFLR
ncbi:unnamed protein product [Ectocarpus sp. 12 AP-2014]